MKVNLSNPCYIPSKNEIGLLPNSSLYVRFHEIAHSEQRNSIVLKIWSFTGCFKSLRFIHVLATQYLEVDAFFKARRAMLNLGVWHKHEREAVNCLATYFEDEKQPNHVAV